MSLGPLSSKYDIMYELLEMRSSCSMSEIQYAKYNEGNLKLNDCERGRSDMRL